MTAESTPRDGSSASPQLSGVGGATIMLTIYLVLLLAVPSSLSVGPWAAIGRPASLWGLVLLFWWLLGGLQRAARDESLIVQPVRHGLVVLIIIVLVSFSAALLRGQPTDQLTSAISGLMRLASWAGVVLVTMDGVRTHHDAGRLVRGLALGGGGLAALGLAQFLTGSSLLGWIAALPGVTMTVEGLDSRGAFTRAAGTAMHPLEHTTVLATLLPVALVTAVFKGARDPAPARNWGWWVPVALITMSAMTASSRSALLGLAIAVLATLPALPRRFRLVVLTGGGILAFVLVAAVPGMLGTAIGLFAGASDDPSTQSRADALLRVPDFLAASPVIGVGFGTFLPRYYIFDNAWALILIELGILGAGALVALGGAAIWSARWSARAANSEDIVAMGRALAASVLTVMVLFIFFDGLSFPMTAGLFFLAVGLSAAIRAIAAADQRTGPPGIQP